MSGSYIQRLLRCYVILVAIRIPAAAHVLTRYTARQNSWSIHHISCIAHKYRIRIILAKLLESRVYFWNHQVDCALGLALALPVALPLAPCLLSPLDKQLLQTSFQTFTDESFLVGRQRAQVSDRSAGNLQHRCVWATSSLRKVSDINDVYQ